MTCLLTAEQGILVNEQAQMLGADSQPIDDLFVCGDCSGGFFVINDPRLMPGVVMGCNMTFAIKAVKVTIIRIGSKQEKTIAFLFLNLSGDTTYIKKLKHLSSL